MNGSGAKHKFAGQVEASVKFGEGVVSIRRRGISEVTIAKVLGREVAQDTGVERVWLDRLIHKETDLRIGNDEGMWELSGAYCTVLERTTRVDSAASNS